MGQLPTKSKPTGKQIALLFFEPNDVKFYVWIRHKCKTDAKKTSDYTNSVAT